MKEADAESELVSEAENRLSPHGKEQRGSDQDRKNLWARDDADSAEIQR